MRRRTWSVAESWHTAAFVRVKKLPKLAALLERVNAKPEPPRPIEPAERDAVVKAAQRWREELTRRKAAARARKG